VEGRRHDLEIRDLKSSLCGQELFADRENGLWRLGPALPARIPLALRSIPLLVRALLA
jgi:hypothetical protein